MSTQKVLEKNNLLFTDDKALELLNNSEYTLLKDYGKDKKFIVWIPYIPLQIT